MNAMPEKSQAEAPADKIGRALSRVTIDHNKAARSGTERT